MRESEMQKLLCRMILAQEFFFFETKIVFLVIVQPLGGEKCFSVMMSSPLDDKKAHLLGGLCGLFNYSVVIVLTCFYCFGVR